MNVAPPVLMVVTDPSIPELMDRVSDAIAGGATWIQYRDKTATTSQRTAWIRAFKERHPNTVLLVNGDATAASEGGADGLHLPGQARNDRAGDSAWLIGRSLHVNDLTHPNVAGLDYAVFGTVFASASHPTGPVAGIEKLREACRLPLPVLAIGGITAENAGDCIRAGAAGVAVIRSVLVAEDPARAATEILQAMREAGA